MSVREEIKDLIHEAVLGFEDGHFSIEKNKLTDKILSIVERDWVSVEDRLPIQKQSNRGVKVLVTLNHRTVTDAIFDDGKFYIGGIILLNVTDWQPLPQPPQAKQGEG